MSEEEIRSVLKTCRVVAVVGLSRNPAKDSYEMAEYLRTGYRVILTSSFADEILGEKY